MKFYVLGALAGVIGLTACSTTKEADATAVTRPTRAAAGTAEGTTTFFLGEGGAVYSRTSAAKKALANSWWEGDGVSGSPSVVISLSEQTASFYKGGKLVGVSAVSTGREGGSTPTGSFRITQKNIDHRSNLYGDYVGADGRPVVENVGVYEDKKPEGTTFLGAPMPYFMRVVNGVGMHTGFLPGFPDSHGCIRMPDEMAAKFYANTSVGTPVRIVR